jgi:hypothetical protein
VRSDFRIVPLSVYSFPSQVPVNKRGLPSFHSDIAWVPYKYSLMISGFIRASQIFATGAFISGSFFTIGRVSMFLNLLIEMMFLYNLVIVPPLYRDLPVVEMA